MNLYLMRHGMALPEHENPLRPLSPEGEKQIKASAAAIARLGIRFDTMLASTLMRSKQTAEIVARTVKFPVRQIIETDILQPSAGAAAAIRYIGPLRNAASVFVSGHLPLLEDLAALLMNGDGKASVRIETGGLLCVSAQKLAPGAGLLEWSLTAEQLALITGNF